MSPVLRSQAPSVFSVDWPLIKKCALPQDSNKRKSYRQTDIWGLCVKKRQLRVIQCTHMVSCWSKFIKLTTGKATLSRSLLTFGQFGHVTEREGHHTRVAAGHREGEGFLGPPGETQIPGRGVEGGRGKWLLSFCDETQSTLTRPWPLVKPRFSKDHTFRGLMADFGTMFKFLSHSHLRVCRGTPSRNLSCKAHAGSLK